MENEERPSGKEQKMCPNRFSDIKTQMKQGPKTEGGGVNMYVLCSSVQSTSFRSSYFRIVMPERH